MPCNHSSLSWKILYSVSGERDMRCGMGSAEDALQDLETLTQNGGAGGSVSEIVCSTCHQFLDWIEVQELANKDELTAEECDILIAALGKGRVDLRQKLERMKNEMV